MRTKQTPIMVIVASSRLITLSGIVLVIVCVIIEGPYSADTIAVVSTPVQQAREIIITDAIRRIRRDGYAAEAHTVHTKDGYFLTMHRIPYKDNNTRQTLRRPVVFLMAGIYASSDAWLLNGRENSLPYLLSNNGYDVWLGNNRGNIYSKRNIWYSPSDREFWNFSWHEMSIYDMPAMIDYIIGYTGVPKIHFIGISQGGTIFLVLNSMLVHYNDVFTSATLLAPVAYVNDTNGALAKVFGPLLGTRNYISNFLEGVEMVSTNKFVKKFLSMACLENERPSVCVSRLWPAVGYDTKYLNKTLLPDIMANFPVGGSVKQIMHYFQGYVSGKFRMYDYGPMKNLLLYKTFEPTDYVLERVTVPVTIYYSENDYIVSVKDIWKLLPRLRNINAIYKIPWKKWNHFDFICGLGVRQFIFERIVKSLNQQEYLSL